MAIEALRRSRAATLLLAAFVCLVLLQFGLQSSRALADGGDGALSSDVTPDAVSDRVAATAAEFRVDESGAATYSIPLYGVPGTAGVMPQLSLNYSSQGGYGPMGQGWSIGGVSAISRCRATREAGDFIGAATPDGDPRPINYTGTDRYCLDGQRLLPRVGGAACNAVSGMSVQSLRTEIESFQRVCAYTPSGGSNGPAFFTVERKDGSISWYGDRNSNGSANRSDGYVETNAPGHTAKALAWAQTRFQDSTGNYIDYLYLENPGTAAGSAEHLLSEVRYTGKTVLPGQSGSAQAPYAKFVFNYTELPSAKWSLGYQSGGSTHTQRRRLTSINSACTSASVCGTVEQARHYLLTYAASASGSGRDQLASVQECSDSGAAVCMAPTVFTWSGGRHEFATLEKPTAFGIDVSTLINFKMGDVDGDGRPDLVFLRGGSGSCSTNWLVTGFSRLDSSGRPVFEGWSSVCLPANISQRGDGAWHLFDYDGDGRDDLFVSGPTGQGWRLYRSTGTGFDTGTNLIAGLSPAIPSLDNKDSQIQLADLNGDGLVDIIYPGSGGMRARLMMPSGNNFAWGAERTVTVDANALPPLSPACYTDPNAVCWLSVSNVPTTKTGFMQMIDFNGDAGSDLLLHVWKSERFYQPGPNCPPIDPVRVGPGRPLLEAAHSGDTLVPLPHVSGEEGNPDAAPAFDQCWVETYYSKLHAFTVQTATASSITLGSYGVPIDGYPVSIVPADANGDGLTDLFVYYGGTNDWQYVLNTGRGFQWGGTLALSDHRHLARFVDVNGDGRADMLYVGNSGSNKVYYVRYALPGGGYSTGAVLPGGNARICEGSGCNPDQMTPLFADFDGDGHVDFMSLKLQNNPTAIVSRSNSRHAPRDVVTRFTNGFGAQTDVVYAPLTNKDLYRRDSGARSHEWGRLSPVMDLLAPIYAVARASSSSPQHGAPNATATVHYRYAGAKVQAGGRGFLGFSEIRTVDPNQAGGFVTTTTTYHQNFPYVGMPYQTIKRALPDQSYSIPACLDGSISNSCFATPGQGFPNPSGNWFSESTHTWEADTDIAAAKKDFAPDEQRPVHVRTLGTVERLRDPFTGTVTSRVETSFDYGAYGNVTFTDVQTKTGGGTVVSTVSTENTYGDDAGRWRLGRLTASTVTHQRGSQARVRTSSFSYDLGSGSTYTGLLLEERVQPGGPEDQALITRHTRDDYGNVIRVQTCSQDELSRCGHNSVPMRPEGTSVNRYQRTFFDSRGRYTTRRYEPFTNPAGGAGAQFMYVETVQARDVFGQPTEIRNDLTGAHGLAVNGAFGRGYYAWTQTDPGRVPGDPDGGVATTTTYRWCGGSAPCPTGAKFYRKVLTTAAPATWTYYDALGRPILETARTFNAEVDGKDVSGVCTAYDAAGRPVRVSNPFFLPETAVSGGYPKMSANICTSSARKWTTTAYDVLGRPTRVTGPDNSTVQTAYSNLATTVTDPRGKATTETRNALGEVTKITDALNTDAVYSYNADGTLAYVHRDAGRGQIRNTFTYDALGRKIRQVDPDAGTTDFEYNALGELIAQTHADGSRIEHKIDARGRVWRKIVKKPDGTTETQSTYTFDTAANGLGQLASETITGTYSGWQGQSGMAHSYSRSYRYDSLGRPSGTTTVIDGGSYTTETVYDTRGRVWKQQDASGRWVMHHYTGRGMLRAICNSSQSDSATGCPTSSNTYLRVLETDAWGNAIHERRGNSAAMEVKREYWADTGRIAGICAGNATTCNLMDEGYAWDRAGNLSTHIKEMRYEETFTYDNLNRLSQARLTRQNGITVNKVTQSFEYDVLGNICHKAWSGGSANYTYRGRSGCGLGGANSAKGGGGTGSVGPHQASQMGSDLFYYDGRGLQTLRDRAGTAEDRFVRYSADDKAYEIDVGTTPTYRSRFWYGPDGQRYKAVHVDSGRTVLYLGNVEVVKESGTTTYRRTIAGVMLQITAGASGAATNHYLFHDQLGSLVRVTDANGALVKAMDYDAQGDRRSPDDPTSSGGGGITGLTYRGFTNHEQFGRLDVIHMNARIYDAALGRFLQPDPVVQAPGNLQSWNAYTYVFNNPLVYTDPTGMISLRKVLAIAIGIVAAVFGQYYITQGMYMAAFGVTVAGGFASGYVATGSLRGGVYGAFGAGLTFGVSAYGFGPLANVVAQGFSGGIMEVMQGGSFGHGFAAAGLTAAFMPQAGHRSAGVRAVKGALIGGAISKATGGKFANGAVSGAIQAALTKSHEVEYNYEDGVLPMPAEGETAQSRKDVFNRIVRNRDLYGIDIPEGYSIKFDDRYMSLVDGRPRFCTASCDDQIGEYGTVFGQHNRSTKTITIFRAGVQPYMLSGIRLVGGGAQIFAAPGLPTGYQTMVKTLGHEAAHARGIDVNLPGNVYHPNAEQAGMNALERYRSLFNNVRGGP